MKKYGPQAWLLLFVLSVFVMLFSCSNTRYPCPSNTKMAAQFDSSGTFSGGFRHNKDKKTGLIKKKKSKKLLDRKSKASLY